MAVDRSYVKSGADRQVDFIDIVAWRSTAEFVCRYFHKGQLVAVQGSIQTRSYTDKEGNKRKAFEVVADNVHFAEPKRDSSYSQAPAQQNAYRQENYRARRLFYREYRRLRGSAHRRRSAVLMLITKIR